MKFFPAFITLAAGANAHAIFQRMAVNGVDQGQLKGIRAPEDSGPITNVNDKDFACNKDLSYLDKTVITVPAGAKVGALFGHVIGGAMEPGDQDQPIAEDHKGPIMVYLAKVDDAANASPEGLSWFKISEKGLQNGRWAVDDMRADDGWHNFTMPACVASGEYLMRVELLALQESQLKNGAQFYMECAQIQVTGSGTSTGTDFAKFPGTYKSNDPGIFLDVYNDEGIIDNNGRPYKIPGPKVLSC
ncbi:glycosyl hydrolase family 61 [Colletotrichum karsti]|uniref:lytic cellulose monooxygenase (C4-dehydrogenating) n=1 Tax=Colletotrichum karsti TaxID=1095194 RepID=A0A9P6LG43_9PEZI|nr:glycosyl hydrolase family 61 [Colletotrichum karsti]KAF9871230.1 glycosyl hydrolase family 61 [Colletotrichum karsti]